MKRKTIEKVGVFALSAIMALTMSASVFAAGSSGAFDSDHTDYNTNGTGNSTATRQANSATTKWMQNTGTETTIGQNSGVINLGKILNVNQDGKFPNVNDFVYKITPISAWDNANVDTTKSGATIAIKDMPAPDNSTNNSTSVNNHLVRTFNAGSADWYSYVTIGDFKDATGTDSVTATNSDAASSLVGDAPATNDDYRRTRTTEVKFTFPRAGYYMYKIEEVGSIQNGDAITADNPAVKKDVAGVDYDNNTYYAVFYVTNTQATADVSPDVYGHGTQQGDTVGAEAGDTITNGATAPAGGVYVHSITSWTNQLANADADKAATDNKASDLQDTQALNNAKDLMNTMDNGGNPAQPNTGRVDGDNNGVNSSTAGGNGVNGNGDGVSDVTHDNLGKVGVSLPPTPNYLEAYRMWNAQTTHDIVLKKNVTGNLGDRTKQFEFTVELTGLENNQTYTTNVKAGSTDTSASATNDPAYTGDETSSVVKLEQATAGTIAQDGKSFTSSATGTATFKVKLRDDEVLVINALPRSATYKITEAASDHVPEYDIVSTNKLTSGDTAIIANATAKNNASNTSLATSVECVDRYDGTVTVIYQNNRDLATVTGIVGLDYMVYAAVLLMLMGAAYAIIKRRREYADEYCE